MTGDSHGFKLLQRNMVGASNIAKQIRKRFLRSPGFVPANAEKQDHKYSFPQLKYCARNLDS